MSTYDYPPDLTPNRPPVSPTVAEDVVFRRAAMLKRMVIVLVVLLAVISLATATFTIVSVRFAQQDNTELLKDAEDAAVAAQRGTTRIEDCTTPGRKCFEDGQARGAELVGSINKAVILAAACASSLAPSRLEQEALIKATTACVVERLAEVKKAR